MPKLGIPDAVPKGRRPPHSLTRSPGASRQCSIEEEKEESSGEEEDEEERATNDDKFPSWTRSEWLMPKLNEQVGLDGDAIFGQAVHRQKEAVDLGDIFGKANKAKTRAA